MSGKRSKSLLNYDRSKTARDRYPKFDKSLTVFKIFEILKCRKAQKHSKVAICVNCYRSLDN